MAGEDEDDVADEEEFGATTGPWGGPMSRTPAITDTQSINLLAGISQDIGTAKARFFDLKQQFGALKAEHANEMKESRDVAVREHADMRREYTDAVKELRAEIQVLRDARSEHRGELTGESRAAERYRGDSFSEVLKGLAKKGGEVILMAILAALLGLVLIKASPSSTPPEKGPAIPAHVP